MSYSKLGYVFSKGRSNTIWQPPYNATPVTWEDWLDIRTWKESNGIRTEFNLLRIEQGRRWGKLEADIKEHFGVEE